jgi:protein TonB
MSGGVREIVQPKQIVQLAAPFAPFPPDIAKDVDILHITRTWTFTTGDRFMSE